MKVKILPRALEDLTAGADSMLGKRRSQIYCQKWERRGLRGRRAAGFQQLTDFYLRLRGFESHPLRQS